MSDEVYSGSESLTFLQDAEKAAGSGQVPSVLAERAR